MQLKGIMTNESTKHGDGKPALYQIQEPGKESVYQTTQDSAGMKAAKERDGLLQKWGVYFL